MAKFVLYPPLDSVTTLYSQQRVTFKLECFDGNIHAVDLKYRTGPDSDWLLTSFQAESEELSVRAISPINDELDGSYDELICEKSRSFCLDLPISKVERIEYRLVLFENNFKYHETEFSGVLVNVGELRDKKSIEASDLFSDVSTSLRVIKFNNNNDTGIFQVSAHAVFDPDNWSKAALGQPLLCDQYNAVTRISKIWLGPKIEKGYPRSVNNCICFSYLRTDGLNVVILPLSGLANSCTTFVEVYDNAHLRLYTQNDSSTFQCDGMQALIGYGYDVNKIMDQLFAIARNKIHFGLHHHRCGVSDIGKKRWYDELLYCTWNGLGSGLSHSQVISTLKELHESNVRLSGIIVDDGWQQTNDVRQLYDFEANPSKFPNGLKGLTDDIRLKYPYIKNIGVWSTLVGYWNGIVPESPLDEQFETIDVRVGDRIDKIVSPKQVHLYYRQYFNFLKSSGITCVKIDHQAYVNEISDSEVRGQLWKPFQDILALEASRVFDNRIIYCMAMVPDIMLYSLRNDLPVEEVPLFRNSDDYFPDIPDSHFWHVYTNLFNTFYTRHLSFVLDFDMFQTKIASDSNNRVVPSLHAAARCISGGPIYITDQPGVHNLDILRAFSPINILGNNAVLRLDHTSIVANPYHRPNSKSLIRVENSFCRNNSKLLGLFNLSHEQLVEFVGNFQHPDSQDDYVLRSYKTGEVWLPRDEDKLISFEPGQWDIVTKVYLTSATLKSGESVNVGSFGLLDSYVGTAAVSNLQTTVVGDELCINLDLVAYGTVGLYISVIPERWSAATVNHLDVDPSKVEIVGSVITIDLASDLAIQGKVNGDAIKLKLRIQF